MSGSVLNEDRHIIQKASKQFQVARLGQLALESSDLQSFFDEVVRTIVNALNVEYAKILKVNAEGNFNLQAGYGWTWGKVGVTIVEGDLNSQAGYTLIRTEPIVVTDFDKEKRFIIPEILANNHVVSGMSVVIGGKSGNYGVLGAHSTRKRTYSRDDIIFLESVSHILASTISNFDTLTQLRRREEEYRTLIDSSPNGVFISNPDGNYTIVNDRAYEITGYTKEELLSMNFQDLIHKDDMGTNPLMLNRLRKDKEMVNELYLKHKTKGKVLVEVSSKILPNGNIQRIVRDLTETKKMEIEMIRASKFESVVHLAGGIAHDFNNLLSVIIGNLSIIESEGNSLIRESAQNAILASKRAADLTRKLLTLAQESKPSKKLIDLRKLIPEIISISLRGSKIQPQVSIPDDLWAIEGDESQVGQVIQNLIINAAQASDDNSEIIISAENFTRKEGGLSMGITELICISIQDFGEGIPPENRDRIFDPFFTTKKEGTGLGLSTTYSIVRNHEGFIDLDSEVGVGTTMRVFLPAVHRLTDDIIEEEVELSNMRFTAHVLVVDDEKMIQDTVRVMLEPLGFSVTTCSNGEEGVEKFSADEFDAVIVDLTIPGGMDGLQILEKLLEIDPEVRCIVSSGYATNNVIENYADFGFSGRIKKPYTQNELISELKRVLWTE